MSPVVGRPWRSNNRWAERTVAELADAARESALHERWAQPERGVLQRRDPRAKWLAALLLLVGVGLVRHRLPLAAGVGAALGAAAWSGVPPLHLLRRAAPLGLPLLALAALTALFPAAGGWAGATRLALRATASLLFTLLLVLTTRWAALMRGLRGLGVPSVFVSVLEQTHGYLIRLPLTAETMFQARRARTVGPVPPRDARRFVGSSMGALLGKAHAAAEATHAAMLARGYGGGAAAGLNSTSPHRDGGRAADLLLVTSAALAAALLLGWDRLLAS